MARIHRLATLAVIAILPALIALQPSVTYACGGSHGGC
jgi:hypothetical protein